MLFQKKNLYTFLSLAIYFVLIPRASAQLTADFSVDNQTGCLSVVSSFSDLSTGNPTSWIWTFYYNGLVTDVRTTQDPGRIFTQPGCHDVKLVVTNAAGMQDSIRRNCFIEVFRNPMLDFAVDTAVGCTPATFQFTNQSTANAAGFQGCVWVFINQNTLASVSSPDLNPSINLTDVGRYDVQLQCTNTNGCDTTIRRNGFLEVVPTPDANFLISDNIGCALPKDVTFTNTSITNGAPGLTYGWTFPGGTPNVFNGQSPPTISYNNTNVFSVTLAVQSSQGCADTATQTSRVILRPITAEFSISDTTPCLNRQVVVTDNSGGAVSQVWDYGDGSPVDSTSTGSSTHIYTSSGIFTISLIVENATGCKDTATRQIEVLSLPPVAFNVNPSFNCDVSTVFTFTDNSPGSPVSYLWDFGDNSTSNLQNPTHVYDNAGTYTVCLTVIDTNSCFNRVCDSAAVSLVTPTANFNASMLQGCAPYMSTFTDLSVSNDTIVSWNWRFDDGSGTNITPGISALQNPTVNVLNPGFYNVTLVITTQNGCRDSVTQVGYIRAGSIPMVDFTVDDDSFCVAETVTFTSTVYNPNYNYNWDFELTSGFTAGGAMATFAYPDTGCVDVALEIENFGCVDSIIKRNILCVFPPVAAFGLSTNRICSTPSTLTIADLSTGPVTNYQWFFNNALFSTLPNPPAIPIPANFPNGNYTIKLIVENTNSGCIDSVESIVTIGSAVADFRISNSTLCKEDNLTFVDLSPPGSARTFFFGNGQFTLGQSGNDVQYSYPDTGLFTVRMVVRDPLSGCADTLDKVDSVRVHGAYAWFDGIGVLGCPGLTTQFMDMSNTSQNTPVTQWSWNFGDIVNNTAFTANTAHTYNNPGSYSVSLAIQDANGCRDSITRTNLVNVSQPMLDFTTSLDTTCLGNFITMNNLSLGANLTYKWIFGPLVGDTSNQVNPNWVFPDTGFQDITLIGTDALGCMDTLVRQNAVFIEQLDLDFTADRTAGTCPPFNVNFTNLTTGKVDSVIWNFGDGTRSFQNDPSHIYSFPGSYDVTLVTFHRDGCTDTLVKSNYINIAGPTGSLTFNPSPVCFGDSVFFTVNFDSAAAIFLDLDDGLLTNLIGQNTTGSVNFDHVYSDTGYFNPVVIVQDVGGCRVTIPSTASVRVLQLPEAGITPSAFSGCVPFEVQLNDNSIAGDTTITNWTWYTSTNDTLVAQDTSYTFPQVGLYTIRLEVEDAYGCRDDITRTFEATPLPVADFVASDSFNCAPIGIDFTDRSSNTFIVDWLWTFGNGDTTRGVQNPRIGYLQDGSYDVQLIVFDANGCSDTLLKTDYIQLRRPTADLYANSLTGCAPDELTLFADSSQVVSDTTLRSYTWQLDLPNGQQRNLSGLVGSTVDSITQAYGTPGTYGVQLVVEDVFGCTDTLIDSVQLYIPPNAAFAITDSAGCRSFSTTFSDQTILGDGNLVGWLYDFQTGDSAFSAVSNYTFTQAGNYDVELFVVDANGCVDSATVAVEVFDLPIVDFMASDTFNCSPIDISFTDQSTNTNVTGWTWNFGDGASISGVAGPTHRYTSDGQFDVQLIATDENGCVDSLTKTAYVHLRRPEAYVYATNPGGCNPVTITLFADSSQILSDTALVGYTWIVETDQGIQPPVSTVIDTFDQSYPISGNYDVTLIVEDVFGCRDTVTRVDYIEIEETTVPNPLSLEVVTVADKGSVSMSWEEFPGPARNFNKYFIHWQNPNTGQFQIVDSIQDINNTSYLHTRNLDTELFPYSYKIQVQNSCLENSDLNLTDQHTTVNLTASPAIDAIQLDWTAYEGWQPTLYQIYEENDYDPSNWTLIATVPGTEVSFVDSNTFCTNVKSYRISALQGGTSNIRSLGNLDSVAPIHPLPTEVLDVTYATVRADSVIDLAWNAYAGYLPERYILEKSENGETWRFLDSLAIDSLTYTDEEVEVDEQNYFYRLRVLDACEDLSPYGFYGKNIVLQVDLDGKYPRLQWTAYEQWENGVLSYDIEVFNNELGIWQFVYSTNANTLIFFDDITELNQGIYCYRIRAREARGNQAEALSNEDCVIFNPTVFTPNAFSPNGDNINDRFIVQAPTLRQATLQIYSRWGKIIYESGDLSQGWDGRYKGAAVPEGVYVFLITGQGEDGTEIELRGTVTLIR